MIAELARYLLLPPGINLLLLLLGFLLLFIAQKAGRWLIFLGIVSLYLLAIPPVATLLIKSVETYPALSPPVKANNEKAIVVLGAGRYTNAIEYGGDSASHEALMRLRYAHELQRQTRLPILVSGGRPRGELMSEAEIMADTLEQSFATEAKWKEGRSDNTFENAVCSEFILGGQQIRNVFLVTHASHMPRAVFAFSLTSLNTTPAPTGFQRDNFKSTTGLQRWLPGTGALAISRTALHEWLGKLYYRFNYGSDDLVRTAAVSC